MQRNFLVLAAWIGILIGATATRASAQAWVNYQGSLELGLDYNLGISDRVIEEGSRYFPDGGTRTSEITGHIEYVPLPRLAIDVSLPFAALTYTGSKTLYPHPGGGSYDDGNTHTTFTDFRGDVRYQLLEDPIAFSPLIGVSIPVQDYETVGNTVAGRHLKQLHLGAAVGTIIGNGYVQLAYTFSLVERYDRTVYTKRFGQNHSDGSLVIGYKLLEDKLDLSLAANGRITHGGIDFTDSTGAIFPGLIPQETLYHDAYLHEDMLLVGPGIGYQITESLAVNVLARFFVWGKNTQNASVYGLGLTWSAL